MINVYLVYSLFLVTFDVRKVLHARACTLKIYFSAPKLGKSFDTAKKKVHYMLQNVQSVTTFPLPPSKNPDFIGTTENAEKNGRQRKRRKRAAEGANGKWAIIFKQRIRRIRRIFFKPQIALIYQIHSSLEPRARPKDASSSEASLKNCTNLRRLRKRRGCAKKQEC